MTTAETPSPLPQRDLTARDAARIRLNEVDGVEEAIERAMRFAALSGKFDPQAALAAAGVAADGPTDSDDKLIKRIAVTAQLSDASDTKIWAPDWIMRASVRGRILADPQLDFPEMVAWRENLPDFNMTSRDLCDALLGRGDFEDRALDRLLAAPKPDSAALERILCGLALVESAAPCGGYVDAVRAALSRASADASDPLLDQGVIGREDELAWLVQGVEAQWSANDRSPQLDMLYLGGIGGIGKSTLLAEIKRRMIEEHDALVVTFDFDRPGIEGGDPLGMSLDLARQVVACAGVDAASLFAERIRNAAESTGFSDKARSEAQSLIYKIADTIKATGRPLLLLLDTLESLALRGDTAASELVRWIRILHNAIPRVAIVAAGRGEPHPALEKDINFRLLTGLPPAIARAMLERLGVTAAVAEKLALLAKGNPLILRLGARLVQDAGGGALTDEALSPELSDKLLAAQLYRLILSRISDPTLRSIAHPGLLLRRINPRIIAEVIWPEIASDTIGTVRAAELFSKLESYAWLVRVEGGWLVHRPELRQVLVDLQIGADPGRAQRLFRRAAEWFADPDCDPDPREALYYRLMLLRWGGRIPQIEDALAEQFTSDMIEDLPERAQDALAVARGERSSRLREPMTASSAKRERIALAPAQADEVAALVERSSFGEAAAMVSRAGDFAGLDPHAPATDAVICALWHSGNAADARRMLRRRDTAAPDAALPKSPVIARSLLMVRADLDPGGFRARAREDDDWRTNAAELVSQAAREVPDLDVAALLLRAEHAEFHSEFADAVWALWSGDPISPAGVEDIMTGKLASVARSRRISVLDRDDLASDPPTMEACLALISANAVHARMISDKLNTTRHAKQQPLIDQMSAAAIATLVPGASADMISRFSGPYSAEQFDAIGKLAEWATLIAVLVPGLRINALAGAARRRGATIAGRWSYGEPPPGWRQPPSDLHSLRQLGEILGAADTPAAISREYDRFTTGTGSSEQRRAALRERMASIIAATPVAIVGNRADLAAAAAQALIENGAPMLLAPAFAAALTEPSAVSAPAQPVPAPSNQGEKS